MAGRHPPDEDACQSARSRFTEATSGGGEMSMSSVVGLLEMDVEKRSIVSEALDDPFFNDIDKPVIATGRVFLPFHSLLLHFSVSKLWNISSPFILANSVSSEF